MIQIYYGLFNSIATYGLIGWGGLYKSALDPLDRLQEKIIEIIGVSDQEKPLSIRQIFIVNCIVYCYNKLKCEFLNKTVNTRNKSLTLSKNGLTIGQRCYSYCATKYYNNLPNSLKNLSDSEKVI